jgi:uncharacterized RDD family membrane protein YckC
MTSGWQVPYEEPGPAPGLAFARHGARLGAYIIDVILVTMIIVLVAVVGALATAVSATSGAVSLAVSSALLLVLAIFVVSLGYFPYFWVRGGATPGMRIFGLYVVRDRDGGPVSGGQAILRLIGYWVASFVFYLGFVWIFIDKRRRGWHDLIAGTVVVQQR